MDNVSEILNDIKVDKSIQDTTLDGVLTNFIKQAISMVCLYIGEDTLPDQLKVIVVRLTEAHYVQSLNDADGAKTYSEEGASWSFNDNELDPYVNLLDRYLSNHHGQGVKGGVWSW